MKPQHFIAGNDSKIVECRLSPPVQRPPSHMATSLYDEQQWAAKMAACRSSHESTLLFAAASRVLQLCGVRSELCLPDQAQGPVPNV